MERTKADAVQAARELLSGVEESLRLSLSRNPLRRRVTSGPGPAPLGRPPARFFFAPKTRRGNLTGLSERRPLSRRRLRALVNRKCNELRVNGFRLRVNGFRLRVNGFRLRVDGFRLRVTGFCLRVNGFRLRVNGFRLKVNGFRLRVNGFPSKSQRLSV